MTRATRAVVFDMDGTLTDSFDAAVHCYITTVVAAGGRPCEASDVVAALAHGSTAEVLTVLMGRQAAEADLRTWHETLIRTASGLLPYPGIERALAGLAPAAALAVATGASRRAAEIILGQTRLRGYFSVLVGGDEVPTPKPSPAGILLACRRLGVTPHEVVYVGDAPSDILAARHAGVTAAVAAWGRLYDPRVPADLVIPAPHALCTLLSRPGSQTAENTFDS